MAIYRLSMSIETRGKVSPITGLPANAVRSAAYNARTQLIDESNGKKTPNYAKKGGLLLHEMVLGKNADSRFLDMGKAWSEVESIEKGANAQLSRKIILSLPYEFTLDQNKELVHRFMETNFADAAFYQFDIHGDESGKSDGKNIHAHIKFPERTLDSNGKWIMKQRTDYAYERDNNGNFVMVPVLRKNGKIKLDKNGNPVLEKKRVPVIDQNTGKQKIGARGRKIWKRENVHSTDWHRKEKLMECRRSWANIINEIAKRDFVNDKNTGTIIRVTEKSHKDRKDGLIPEPTMGPIVTNLARRGITTDRFFEYKYVKENNLEIKRLQNIVKNESDKARAAMLAQEHIQDELCSEKAGLKWQILQYNKILRAQKGKETAKDVANSLELFNEKLLEPEMAYEEEQKRLAREYEQFMEKEREAEQIVAKEQGAVAARLNSAMQIAVKEYRINRTKKEEVYRLLCAAKEAENRVNEVLINRREKQRAVEEKYGQSEKPKAIKALRRGMSFKKDRPRAVIIDYENGDSEKYVVGDFSKLVQRHRGDIQRYYDKHPEIPEEKRIIPDNLEFEKRKFLEMGQGHGKGRK